jgi:hypothetical protein
MNSWVVVAVASRQEGKFTCDICIAVDRLVVFLFCKVLPVGYHSPCRSLSR